MNGFARCSSVVWTEESATFMAAEILRGIDQAWTEADSRRTMLVPSPNLAGY